MSGESLEDKIKELRKGVEDDNVAPNEVSSV
jgi:hypothetical protein